MGKTTCSNADGLKRGAWTADEDQKLIAYIQRHGDGGWRTLPEKAGLKRCGKSCRLRWANYLRPDIKRGEFSSAEEQKIIELHATLGNRWSAIARHLPRRTDNEIKNYWNSHLKKRLKETGIDDVTHMHLSNNNGPSHGDDTNNITNNCATNSNDLRPPSASAQLLNKLATKLASPRGPGLPSLPDSPDPSTTMPRPVSTSARVLNEMASRLKTPLHCLGTLKSVLSTSIGSADGATSNGTDNFCAGLDNDNIGNFCFVQRARSASSHSESTSEASRSVSTGVVYEMDGNLALVDSADIEVLKDWQLGSLEVNSGCESSKLLDNLGDDEGELEAFMTTCGDNDEMTVGFHDDFFDMEAASNYGDALFINGLNTNFVHGL